MSLLEIDDASVYYEDNFQALYNINLNVEEGEIFACIGANGAGKSTLLKTISGMLVPREGRILFDGTPIDHMSPDRRVQLGISMVPEGRRVFPSLTVHENLQIGAYRNRKGPWNLDTVYDMFPLLQPLKKRQASGLSGGEQQALAIGRSLMSNPRLILMDEVSLGLAPVVIRRIYEAFPKMLESGCTILVVEQDVQHVLTVARHVACFLEGRIVLEDEPKNLTNEQITAAYFGV
jgi:branched-chain amino acid transport system ATP-binding protein